jgi:hypothetical protein
MHDARVPLPTTESDDTVISIESVVKASSQQVACSLEDEVVVLSLANGAYYGLDPIAARVWTLIQEARPVSAIRDVLLEEYTGVTAEQCTRDLVVLLEQLAGWDLIEIEGSST